MNRQPYQPYQPPAYRGQSYQQSGYQQTGYQQMAPMQQMPMQYPQPGMISARYVTGREEAIAATVMPDGNVWLFVDNSRGRIYAKSVDPNTGFANFREYGYIPPQQEQAMQSADEPQYVPVAAFNALMDRVKQLEAAMNREEAAE